jgi:hypothetical protein
MTTRKIRKASPAGVSAVAIAGFTSEQQASLRNAVASALVAGKKDKEAKEAKGSATNKLIAALACPALLAHRFEFQVTDRKGNVTETKQASLYDYARKGAPFYVKGKQEKARLTGFKAAILAYAGINDPTSDLAEKGWMIIKGQALKTAIALADNTIAASMIDGKLVLSGGNGTIVASGLLDAAKKSTAALVGKVNARGTNSGKGKAPGKAPAATAKPDVDTAIKLVAKYMRQVAAGTEAISNTRLTSIAIMNKAMLAVIKSETGQDAIAAAAKPAKPAAGK